ncbi:hypothetical protein [uncultured Acinetobacter sp.]|uniref:hypothetical protein n=1 Tax=uncultured Acinetobacter sp. TaxID=165433 RepID=UPI002583A60E|nr:hypothetical protein [uncultured Acinetobacter sp.]
MIRLKYLTFCLLGLSLSGCTQHVIKTNNEKQALDQQAVRGLNAMYQYPSYDYSGHFSVNVDTSTAQSRKNHPAPDLLDPALQLKIDQFLADQQIKLSSAEKQAFYAAIAQQKKSGALDPSRFEKIAETLLNILNDVQFKFDGSIHYRKRIGSFNLTARYEKPTLLVQAKVPMILDLKAYRFYTNYFAIMPYLVNQESQDSLAYLDFSKYSEQLKQVNMQKLVEYLKASTAVMYDLAEPGQLQRLSVNRDDQAKGVVEKIRLKTTLEDVSLQSGMFEQVNQKYFNQSVLGLKDQSLEQWAEGEATAQQAEKIVTGKETPEQQADAAALSLYQLLNQKFNLTASEELEATELESESDPEASDQESSVAVVDGLDAEACQALNQSNQPIAAGDATYCMQQYDIDVLQSVQTPKMLGLTEARAELAKTFAAYDQNQFIDQDAFKALWNKHQAEVQRVKAKVQSSNPFVIDVGLDAQGRAATIDYNLGFTLPGSDKKLNLRADTLIQNYGHATPIDTKQLKQAKSFKEASKGSMIEGLVGNLSKTLEQDTTSKTSSGAELSWGDQLNHLAERTYDQTRSYEKTFNAVFIAKLTADSPEFVRHYSRQDLNEIAQVYAYWYSDEKTNPLNAKRLAVIKQLQQKHKLVQDDQFDAELGYDVDRIVTQAMQTKTERQQWKTLQQQFKHQPQRLFAQQYMLSFEKENELDATQRKQLLEVANILGCVYVDTRQNKLSPATVKGVQEAHLEYIDYDLFKQVYVQLLTH